MVLFIAADDLVGTGSDTDSTGLLAGRPTCADLGIVCDVHRLKEFTDLVPNAPGNTVKIRLAGIDEQVAAGA